MINDFRKKEGNPLEETIGSVAADGVCRGVSGLYLCLLGPVGPERAGGAGPVFVHLDDPARCAECCAGLFPGGQHPALRLDGGAVCSAVVSHLCLRAAVLPSVGLPRGDEPAARRFGASCPATAGLYGALRQRQAPQGHSGEHRRGGDLSCPSAAGSVCRHGNAGRPAGAAVRL